jgi:pimeloyl-ACP methyl ester carboxylesterase
MGNSFRRTWAPSYDAAGGAKPLFSAWKEYHRCALIGGRRLRYLDVGTGTPLLLVHGLGASWSLWSHNLPALIAEHRVIVVDLPGFGASQSLVGPVSFDDYGIALAGLLDFIGIDSAVAVGHSLGGLICQRLATLYPSRVGALVLVSTTAGELSARMRALFLAVAWGTAPFGLIPKALITPAMRNVLAVPALRFRLISPSKRLPGGCHREAPPPRSARHCACSPTMTFARSRVPF